MWNNARNPFLYTYEVVEATNGQSSGIIVTAWRLERGFPLIATRTILDYDFELESPRLHSTSGALSILFLLKVDPAEQQERGREDSSVSVVAIGHRALRQVARHVRWMMVCLDGMKKMRVFFGLEHIVNDRLFAGSLDVGTLCWCFLGLVFANKFGSAVLLAHTSFRLPSSLCPTHP